MLSTVELLVRKFDLDRAVAIELIDQIDDDDVLNSLIDGGFDHMPSPIAAALLTADQRMEATVDRAMSYLLNDGVTVEDVR